MQRAGKLASKVSLSQELRASKILDAPSTVFNPQMDDVCYDEDH